MIEFIGKSLLIDRKVLVVADLHLGYEGSMRKSGVLLPSNLYEQIIEEFDRIFAEVFEKAGKKKLEKVVLLGDLKHEIGSILREEWKEVSDLIDYLGEKTEEIIVIKGNHDNMVKFITERKNVGVVDYFVWEGFCFLHGDKEFPEIYDKKIKYWIIGHGHPAVTLSDNTKNEKYKCFLIGSFKGKKVIVIPSFFSGNEGTDVRDYDMGFPWDFKFRNFDVKVVSDSENLEVLDFGKLRDL